MLNKISAFCEGYTDVLSMHQAGIENVVASSSTALTHGQIRMIIDLQKILLFCMIGIQQVLRCFEG